MSDTTIRRAERDDLPEIVAMLADDALGATREDVSEPLNSAYLKAFRAIDADPNQFLAVAAHGDEIVGCLQLTFIPGLSRRGAWRAQIESVRVARSARRTGLGRQMFDWAIDMARSRGCSLVQLTTDSTRPEAHRFYETLGFTGSHIGFKLQL